MKKMQPQNQIDVWERWRWLWQGIFYIGILISVGLALREEDLGVSLWVAGVLTLLMLLWHWGGMRFAYQELDSWEERPLPRFIILVVDIALWFILVNLSLAYYVALFGLFIQVFYHLPIRLASITALLLTILMVFEQLTEAGQPLTLTSSNHWLFFYTGLASIAIGVWISAIIGQSTQRRDLIEQLESAQADLAAAERREGVLEERQRLAREIHDTLAQGFTSIVMHLEAAEQALQTEPEIMQKHLDQARSTARASLDQARRVVQDLRPDLLEEQSLPDAIAREAMRWQQESGITVNTNTTGHPTSLHPNIEVTLLRATQEALNNVWKHAHATDVQVTLSYMDDVIILDVQDNGVGVEEATRSSKSASFSGGYGLQAMQERAQQCGGSVTVESDPGEGTIVAITIPLT